MKKYSLKQRLNILITAAIFLAFLFLTIDRLIQSGKNWSDWLLFLVCLVIFLGGVYYEALKKIYYDALYALNFQLDTELAEKKYEQLCQWDVTGNYRKNTGIFEVMIAIERKDAKKALELIEQNEKKFRSNVELLVVMYYYQMRAYLLLGNAKKVNEIYSDVLNVEKMKKKPNIISYDEFAGLHEMALGNKQKARECFRRIPTAKKNPKELVYLYQTLAELSDKKEREKYLKAIEEVKGDSR